MWLWLLTLLFDQNCNHGKYPLPRHLWMEMHCSSAMTSSIDIQDYDIFFQLTTQALHRPPSWLDIGRPGLNQDVNGCDTQLLEVIHSPHTVYLPQSYYYYISLLHWKGIYCQGCGGYSTRNGCRSAKVFYHLSGNSLDMSGIQRRVQLFTSHL